MDITYAAQTIDAPNPFRRYAHRNRMSRSVRFAVSRATPGSTVLDFGCGSGAFIEELSKRSIRAVGYEPYMAERANASLPIFSRFDDIESAGPYGLVTLFETIEHLTEKEFDSFLRSCRRVLAKDGGILISGPIEVGPALVLKEISRYLCGIQRVGFKKTRFGHSLLELLGASFLGIAAKRGNDIKCTHKGFDFRKSIRYMRDKGWRVKVLTYGPLPLGTWYGNSQVFLWVDRLTGS